MKKILILSVLVLFLGSLIAIESAPSETVGFVKYSNASAGYLAVAFALDNGTLLMASDLGDLVGTASTVSQWTGTTWQTATKLPPPIGWSGNFAINPGIPYMVNSTAPSECYVVGNIPTQISYTFTSGQFTFMMLRLDRSDLTITSALGDEIGVCNTISRWTGSTWQTATKLPPPIGWSGNFAIEIGDPLMVNATGNGVWPVTDGGNISKKIWNPTPTINEGKLLKPNVKKMNVKK